jgi:peptidoglycan/xylan/chitin deacetylase (PgdA/CDA1 family)
MTWEQVRDLNEKGMTIGAHTKSHPKLTKITSKEKVQDEILGSKKVLEAKLSIPVSYFAYPYGLYDDSIIDVVKESGFSVALTVKRGSDHRLKDIYTLKRYDLGSSFSDFKNVLR